MKNQLAAGKSIVWLLALLCAAALVACGGNPNGNIGGFGDGGSGNGDGSVTGDGSHPVGPLGDAGNSGPDSGMCNSMSPDEQGCSCQAGQTHYCYTGPAGTRKVGACKDGIQTCITMGEFGHFGPCTGETLPGPPNCGDNIDHACDGLPGCMNPACMNTPACMGPPPPPPPPPDAGGMCVPPIGSILGGNQRCPNGTVTNINGLCCPCGPADCGTNQSCCAAAVCANDPSCTSCSGMPLDPICGGNVDQDCDDFPEDCDQLCCPCKPAGMCMVCPSGQVSCPDVNGNPVCTNVATDPNACGACDGFCNPGQSCVNGLCQ